VSAFGENARVSAQAQRLASPDYPAARPTQEFFSKPDPAEIAQGFAAKLMCKNGVPLSSNSEPYNSDVGPPLNIILSSSTAQKIHLFPLERVNKSRPPVEAIVQPSFSKAESGPSIAFKFVGIFLGHDGRAS
jgi:hypothetical protein